MSNEKNRNSPSRASEQAMHEADAHNRAAQTGTQQDAVPGDDLAHAHSPAAHKNNPFPVHTTPQGNVAADTRQDLKEPPQEVSRIGKTNRNQ